MDALLLDFNGVIVDDEPLHFASFRDVLRGEGIVLTEAAYYAAYLGLDDRAAFREALRRDGRPPEPAQVARLVARKAAAYADLAARELPVVPGVTAFVRGAAARARIAVVSGALGAEVAVGLTRAGIADVIEVVVSADDVATTKPDPAGFRLALARLAARHGGGAWRAAVIEDSLPGLAAARATGAGCVMLTTSHAASTVAGADAVWSDFSGHHPTELDAVYRAVSA